MRKVLGRVALLLGVLLVAAAAWWGATTLFEEDEDDEAPDSGQGCVPASRRSDAVDAERAFVKKYADSPWFRDANVKRTDEGFVLQVTVRRRPPTPGLPTCPSGVPLVLRGGPPATG